jgi:hypothetical protein
LFNWCNTVFSWRAILKNTNSISHPLFLTSMTGKKEQKKEITISKELAMLNVNRSRKPWCNCTSHFSSISLSFHGKKLFNIQEQFSRNSVDLSELTTPYQSKPNRYRNIRKFLFSLINKIYLICNADFYYSSIQRQHTTLKRWGRLV